MTNRTYFFLQYITKIDDSQNRNAVCMGEFDDDQNKVLQGTEIIFRRITC